MGNRAATARRWGIPIALSVAVHGAVLLLARERERPARQVPIELEVVHLAPRAAGPPAAPAPAADEAPSDAEAPVPQRQVRRVQPRGPPAAAGEVVEAVEAPPAAVDEPPPAPLVLEPDWDRLADRLGWVEPEAPPVVAPPPVPPDPGGQLAALLADDRAIERGTRNPAHYWSDLRRRLEADWSVEKAALRDGPGKGSGLGLDAAWEGWREQAATYAATGNPYGEKGLVPGSPELADRGRPLPDPSPAEREREMADRGTFRTSRVALVLVVQDDDGGFREARLQRSSGSAVYDRAALQQAERLAALDLGLPPDGTQSLWSFEATLHTTPPLPIAGCAVDAYFIPTHCFYPLSQRMQHAVRLVGVWRAGETPGVR